MLLSWNGSSPNLQSEKCPPLSQIAPRLKILRLRSQQPLALKVCEAPGHWTSRINSNLPSFLPGNPCWLTLGWLMQLHLLTHQIHKFHQIPPGIAVPKPEQPLWTTVDLVAEDPNCPTKLPMIPPESKWHCHHSEAPGEDAWRAREHPFPARSIQSCVFKHKQKLDSSISKVANIPTSKTRAPKKSLIRVQDLSVPKCQSQSQSPKLIRSLICASKHWCTERCSCWKAMSASTNSTCDHGGDFDRWQHYMPDIDTIIHLLYQLVTNIPVIILSHLGQTNIPIIILSHLGQTNIPIIILSHLGQTNIPIIILSHLGHKC